MRKIGRQVILVRVRAVAYYQNCSVLDVAASQRQANQHGGGLSGNKEN